MPTYSEEQKNDIQGRTDKALEALKELNLYPACAVQKVRMQTQDGQEVFVDSVLPYLRDTYYVADGASYVEPKKDESTA